MVFYHNGCKVIMEINYEALGRYVAAKEQAEKFATERNQWLKKLKELIDLPSGNALGYIAGVLDLAGIEALLPQLREADQNLLHAVTQANQVAEDCGKPKLSFFPSRLS